MKAVLGLVSLLVVLAIVGLLASRQLKPASSLAAATASAAAAAGLAPESVSAYASAASATAGEQSKKVQDQVLNDVMKAMQQGADADKKEPQ